MFRGAAPLVLIGCLGLGCGSDPATQPDDGPDAPNDPPPRPAAEVAEAIGRGDGSPSSVSLVPVLDPLLVDGDLLMPTGLDWNPARRGELWITLVQVAAEAPCTPTVGTGCAALEGRMAIVAQATSDAPEGELVMDGNGWHFLRRPMGLAFANTGERQFLSTCGEARTANYTDEEVPYNGPVLWDADRSIFGATPGPGMNGTHVDMLHETPYCMGITHERGNVFWVFNGDAGSFDRYDFNEPHAPGGDDHSDGEIWRYGEGELSRVPNVPSHMAYDSERRLLFVADSGNGRVVTLDTTSGTADGEIVEYENLPTNLRMSGAVITELVPQGLLEVPSGLTFEEDVVFATDHATGHIVALDLDGNILRELDTGLPPDSLAGISIGPDDKAYITDLQAGQVLRIEPN